MNGHSITSVNIKIRIISRPAYFFINNLKSETHRIMIKHKFKTIKNAFSLPEIMISVSVLTLVFIFFHQMLSHGTKNVAVATWQADRQRESQLFFKILRDDLKRASDSIQIDYSKPLAQEVNVTPSQIIYSKGNYSDDDTIFENPITVKNQNHSVIKNDQDKIINFDINRISKLTGSSADDISGYKLKIAVDLKEKCLQYSRTLISGTISNKDESIELLNKKIVLNDVDFVYLEHEPVKSELDNSIIGAILHIVIRVKSISGPNKTALFKQSIKSTVKAVGL